jgi:serine/threonine protein kinase
MEELQVRVLFMRALELEPENRAPFLDAAAVPAEVRNAVLTLLRHDSESETFFAKAVSRERAAHAHLQGERFGPYELRELVGRGGMGAVYKAERVDQELHQTVAIKIVECAWLNPRAVERFRQEREMLAALVHPNIARLLHAGTRDDGLPYLVMEYVDGLPLDAYCTVHKLRIAERLQVFLHLCDAVEYAHGKLVVHRDLKPSNIMVTSDGTPKLLDFGVAKAIGAGQRNGTQTLVLTPEFASPEQVLGDEITTATDVYGLGAVLYHLLTNRPPHTLENLSPHELQRAICENGPVRPSAVRADLAGDLENVLLKALDAEPQRRYRSAREFADDLRRYLSRRPVLATPASWPYRSRRFLQRNAVASLLTALATTAILTGAGVSIYEAHRASNRFSQVRELANHFIFDFERLIHDVPNTLPARQMVVETARNYLGSLAEDARNNADLTRELADSHYQLGLVEIGTGQSIAAQTDLEKAAALLHSVKADCCGPPASRLRWIVTMARLGRVYVNTAGVNKAEATSALAVGAAREWLGQAPAQPEAERALAEALLSHGVTLRNVGRPSEARRSYEEAVTVGARLVAKYPADEELAFNYAVANEFLGEMCLYLDDGQCGQRYGNVAVSALAPLIERHPQHTRWREERARALSTVAASLDRLADDNPALHTRAVEASQDAYRVAQENVQLNPDSKYEADQLSATAERFGRALFAAGRKEESLAPFQHSAAIIDQLYLKEPKNGRVRRIRAINRGWRAECLMELKRWDAAVPLLREAADYVDEMIRDDPADQAALRAKISILKDQAVILERQGRLAEARARCQEGLEIGTALLRQDPAMKKELVNLPDLEKEARKLGVRHALLAGKAGPSP